MQLYYTELQMAFPEKGHRAYWGQIQQKSSTLPFQQSVNIYS